MAASYRVPARYKASELLRITPVVNAGQPAANGVLRLESDERILQLQMRTLGRRSLAEVLQNPTLDLYRAERERTTLEDVMEQISADGDIQIRPVDLPRQNGTAAAIRISFSCPDKQKARAAVNQLTTLIQRQN
jgi:hypothetical protein